MKAYKYLYDVEEMELSIYESINLEEYKGLDDFGDITYKVTEEGMMYICVKEGPTQPNPRYFDDIMESHRINVLMVEKENDLLRMKKYTDLLLYGTLNIQFVVLLISFGIKDFNQNIFLCIIAELIVFALFILYRLKRYHR